MTKVEHSVVIQRPVEEVWAYAADPANNPVWQGPVIEVRPAAAAPLEAGSTFEEVMQFLGRRFNVTWTVTEYEPMRRSAVRTSSGPVPMQGSYRFQPMSGDTRFTIEMELEAHGYFKLAEPVFARMARREAVSSCELLKELLEARAEASAP